MPQTCGNIVVHLIFSTKQRLPLITPEIRTDLHAYLGGIVRETGGRALIINGICDHLHMLIRIRPMHSVAEVTRIIKTNSSKWIHAKGHAKFAWQAGYGAFSAEIRKTRPCVVISPDEMNRHLQTVIVAPMTTVVRAYPTRIPLRFQGKSGQAALDQLRAVDPQRLVRKLGTVSRHTAHEVSSLLVEMFRRT
jgi:mRNA interferase MazF